ncbi:MAG TPA: carboxypeptidase-like regulatory domain-containing protein [Thermoanaerobaculia bacterium]|jgi:hypothetical protein|nr:carboxypeptidase-like regulatory domain-containing protein [Thermoanaerobaculia bacterium]
MAFFPVLLAAFLAVGDTACIDFKLETRAGFTIESPDRLAGELRLRALPPNGDLAPVAIAGGKARVCGPAGSEVEASASVSGYWIRRETVIFGPADSRGEAKLTLWPLGLLSGELKRPDSKTPAPREILVTTLPPRGVPRNQEPPKGQLSCPVDPRARFRCELPAATYDLSFSLSPYAPVYRWQVQLAAGRNLDLGSLTLRRGASVAGWVTTEDGSPIDPRRCQVHLRPLEAAGRLDSRVADQIEGSTIDGNVGADGFFQLFGVRPGVYEIEAQLPPFAPARRSPVEVVEGAESSLREPLRFQAKSELAVQVDPPRDWLGLPWRVQATPWIQKGVRGDRTNAWEGTTDAEGMVKLPHKAAGQYHVVVFDSRGTRFLDEESVVLEGFPAVSRLDIRWVDLEGTVRLGREPLQANLLFGWALADSPRFHSDAEGQFQGVLPKDGPWIVEIQAADGEFTSQAVAEVEADRDGKASVSIDLPDTRLFGRVTLPEGMPAAEAWVMLQAGEIGMTIRADAEGRFNFRGLPPGSAFLQAERQRSPGITLRAHTDALPLVADSSFGPVELRLAPSRTLRGRVVSPLGAVASASLEIDAGDGLPIRSQARTDLSGEFSAEIPADASRARIIVLAPGRALQAFVVPVDYEPTLALSGEAGDVEIEAPWMIEAKGRERGMWIAVQNGILLPMPFLFQWVDLQNGDRTALVREGKMKIGHLPPASYQFCNLTMTDLIAFQLTGTFPPGAVCAGGALAAGGTLRLEVPKPQRSGE